MTKSKTDENEKPRIPGQKKRSLGLKVPTIQSPHLELVSATRGQSGQTSQTTDNESSDSHTGVTTPPSHTTPSSQTTLPSKTTPTRQRSQTTQPRQTRQTVLDNEPVQTPIAPVRDFHKYANSITRDAVSANVFGTGKAKQLYDVLYLKTRGAIVPTVSVRISKTKLMREASIGSRNTFDTCVARLENAGLLKVTVFIGEAEGNEFRVFTPEEVGIPGMTGQTGQTRQPTSTGMSSSAQKLGELVTPESGQTSADPQPVNTGATGERKTLFKDFLNPDDETHVRRALETLTKASREVTGAEILPGEWKAFQDLIDLFISETIKASDRAGQVSSFLKFGIENLRRRLMVSKGKVVDLATTSDIPKAPDPEPMSDENAKRFADKYSEILNAEAVKVAQDELDDWQQLLTSIRGTLPDHVFATWFSRLTIGGMNRDDRVISVFADEVTADWIRSNYEEVIDQAIVSSGLDGFRVEWKGAIETAEQFRSRFSDEDWMKIDLFVKK